MMMVTWVGIGVEHGGGRALLSVKFVAHEESLAPERRFRELKRKRLWVRCLRLVLEESVLPFLRGMMSLLGEGVTV